MSVEAAGAEVFTFDELVRVVRAAVRSRALLVHLPVPVVLATTRLMGLVVGDVVLTRDEVRELSESLLVSRDPAFVPRPTSFRAWLAANRSGIGRRWSSELARNFRLAGSS